MKITRRILSAAALLCLGLAAACESATFSEAGATGFMVSDASGVVVTVDGSRVSGPIVLTAGESRTLYASLLGPGGTAVQPSPSELVRVSVGSDGLVEWIPGYQGAHTGTLRGQVPGSTSMTVELVRGGARVHASPPIPVVVTP